MQHALKTDTGDTGVSLFCQDIGKKSIVKANLESDVPPARNITLRPGNLMVKNWGLPSGKLTVSYWKWPFIVDLPIKIVMLVYQRVDITLI